MKFLRKAFLEKGLQLGKGEGYMDGNSYWLDVFLGCTGVVGQRRRRWPTTPDLEANPQERTLSLSSRRLGKRSNR
ncbi:MAG: hypothetical protein N2170_09960 [Bacteroidia bacterium]|nr:hypothetical protein [Bacteroidia bacterium]